MSPPSPPHRAPPPTPTSPPSLHPSFSAPLPIAGAGIPTAHGDRGTNSATRRPGSRPARRLVRQLAACRWPRHQRPPLWRLAPCLVEPTTLPPFSPDFSSKFQISKCQTFPACVSGKDDLGPQPCHRVAPLTLTTRAAGPRPRDLSRQPLSRNKSRILRRCGTSRLVRHCRSPPNGVRARECRVKHFAPEPFPFNSNAIPTKPQSMGSPIITQNFLGKLPRKKFSTIISVRSRLNSLPFQPHIQSLRSCMMLGGSQTSWIQLPRIRFTTFAY